MAWSVASVTDETILDFVDTTGVTFPVMRDEAGTYFEYDVTQESAPFPLDVVVDKQGTIRLISERYDPDELEALIDELIAE